MPPPQNLPASSNPQYLIPNPSLSTFRLLVDPPAHGAWNMAVDEALLEEAAAEGRCTLRLYGWSEPTLSLGYFQAYADRREHSASLACPAVRRPSGGGAILHDCELTYSLAVAECHPLAFNRLRTYQVVHEALIGALAQWGIEAEMFSQPGSRRSDAPLCDSATKRRPFLCFQRRSPGDVLLGGVKIAGSAQRRRGGAVLQHGSVLLGRSAAAPELDGLKELTGKTISVEEFIQGWLETLGRALAVRWHHGSLPAEHRHRVESLVAEKYACPAWTEDRGRSRRLL
jgi:lipoate-protein ligase A